MLCPKCNSEVGDSSKFCQHCGAPLETQSAQPETREREAPARAEGNYDPVFLPREILKEKERIILEERGHKKLSFRMAGLGGGLLLLIAFIAFLVAIVSPVALAIAFPMLIIAVATFILAYYYWRNTIYVLTTDRIIVYRSVIGKSLYETRLDRVQDLRVHVGPFQRLANCGNILVSTAGTALVEATWKNIHQPMEKLRIMRETIGI